MWLMLSSMTVSLEWALPKPGNIKLLAATVEIPGTLINFRRLKFSFFMLLKLSGWNFCKKAITSLPFCKNVPIDTLNKIVYFLEKEWFSKMLVGGFVWPIWWHLLQLWFRQQIPGRYWKDGANAGCGKLALKKSIKIIQTDKNHPPPYPKVTQFRPHPLYLWLNKQYKEFLIFFLLHMVNWVFKFSSAYWLSLLKANNFAADQYFWC